MVDARWYIVSLIILYIYTEAIKVGKHAPMTISAVKNKRNHHVYDNIKF